MPRGHSVFAACHPPCVRRSAPLAARAGPQSGLPHPSAGRSLACRAALRPRSGLDCNKVSTFRVGAPLSCHSTGLAAPTSWQVQATAEFYGVRLPSSQEESNEPLEFVAEDYETIAAVVTGGQQGAVSIVRLSGMDAVDVARRVFLPAGRQRKRWTPTSHRIYYGAAVDASGKPIDEARHRRRRSSSSAHAARRLCTPTLIPAPERLATVAADLGTPHPQHATHDAHHISTPTHHTHPHHRHTHTHHHPLPRNLPAGRCCCCQCWSLGPTPPRMWWSCTRTAAGCARSACCTPASRPARGWRGRGSSHCALSSTAG
jgi:hypothetical protein